MQTTLKAGSATANITPPLGTAIPGGFRPRYAENIDDELFAKAIVIDNGYTRLALVTCDLIAVTQQMADRAKERIADRCDIPGGACYAKRHAYAYRCCNCRLAWR